MKKIAILLITLVGLLTVTQAQIKPVSGDIGLGFKISGLENISFNAFSTNSFSGSELLGRFYLSDKMAFRTTLGLNLQNKEDDFSRNYINNPAGGNPVQVDSSIITSTNGFGVSLAPGVEFHFLSQATKLDPYAGAFIPFGFKGPVEVTVAEDYKAFDQVASQVLVSRDVTTTTKTDGGLSIGLGLVAGFNYFFSDNFAIGAEYNLSFLSSSEGGAVRTTQTGTVQPTSDPTVIQVIDNSTEVNQRNSEVSAGVSTGGVNISIFW